MERELLAFGNFTDVANAIKSLTKFVFRTVFMMTLIVENFNEKHIGLLKEMAGALNFSFKELVDFPTETAYPNNAISEVEEKEMTSLSMQASAPSLAELWDKEDDNYWNSYLEN